MISLAESLAIIDEELGTRRVEAERLPTASALGRVLAEDVASALDLPPFDKAAMDGYALPDGDERATYDVIEQIPAGKVPTRSLAPGQAARVMTGAPVPPGTGKVVIWEKTDNGVERVTVHDHGGSQNICRRGEDIRTGEMLYRAGTRIGALELANLIGCGVGEVAVRRPVTVAILVTGDEVRAAPDSLAPGTIIDTNGPMLEALAPGHGLQVVWRTIVPDDLTAHIEAIDKARQKADIVVLTGGVSQGDRDFVDEALVRTGFAIHFDRVSVKPGKPLTFATHPGGQVACGLPGNPVSVLNGFHLAVSRIAAILTGRPVGPRTIRLPLGTALKRRDATRTAFLPGRIEEDGTIVTVPYHGSAHLIALGQAEGVIEFPRDTLAIDAGQRVAFHLRG